MRSSMIFISKYLELGRRIIKSTLIGKLYQCLAQKHNDRLRFEE